MLPSHVVIPSALLCAQAACAPPLQGARIDASSDALHPENRGQEEGGGVQALRWGIWALVKHFEDGLEPLYSLCAFDSCSCRMAPRSCRLCNTGSSGIRAELWFARGIK